MKDNILNVGDLILSHSLGSVGYITEIDYRDGTFKIKWFRKDGSINDTWLEYKLYTYCMKHHQ